MTVFVIKFINIKIILTWPAFKYTYLMMKKQQQQPLQKSGLLLQAALFVEQQEQ
jgi:hypothetical protein